VRHGFYLEPCEKNDSGYKGVTPTANGKWLARVGKRSKVFDTKVEAALAVARELQRVEPKHPKRLTCRACKTRTTIHPGCSGCCPTCVDRLMLHPPQMQLPQQQMQQHLPHFGQPPLFGAAPATTPAAAPAAGGLIGAGDAVEADATLSAEGAAGGEAGEGGGDLQALPFDDDLGVFSPGGGGALLSGPLLSNWGMNDTTAAGGLAAQDGERAGQGDLDGIEAFGESDDESGDEATDEATDESDVELEGFLFSSRAVKLLQEHLTCYMIGTMAEAMQIASREGSSFTLEHMKPMFQRVCSAVVDGEPLYSRLTPRADLASQPPPGAERVQHLAQQLAQTNTHDSAAIGNILAQMEEAATDTEVVSFFHSIGFDTPPPSQSDPTIAMMARHAYEQAEAWLRANSTA